MSPAELAKSGIGRGFRVEVYCYHFKALHRLGVITEAEATGGGSQSVTRYELADHLNQSVVDAVALKAIARVLASISEPLEKWIDKPFLDEIGRFVNAAGHGC